MDAGDARRLDDSDDLDAYQLPRADGSWWVVGWDPSLGTFFAQEVRSGAVGEGEKVLQDHGVHAHEIRSVEQLERVVGRHLPEHAAQALMEDAGRQLEEDPSASLPWALRQDVAIGTVEEPADADAWQVTAARVRQRIADQTLGSVSSLPAAPVAEAFERLGLAAGLPASPRRGTQGQLIVFVATLGIDASLVSGILNGGIQELDADHIGQVCEGLVCSPFDLWGALLARSALDIYPPERWPRRIEPLDSGRTPPTTLPEAEQLLREFVETQALRRLRDVDDVPEQPDDEAIADGTVVATAYRRVAILGHLDGQVTKVPDEGAPVDPEAEYHIAFRQVGYPVSFGDIPDDDHRIPSAGWDVDPQLAHAAGELRRELAASTSGQSASAIELVRFTPPQGPEVWLMWDPASETWEHARDPRDLYPGSRADVLDPDGWADPRSAGPVDHPDGVPGPFLPEEAYRPDLDL